MKPSTYLLPLLLVIAIAAVGCQSHGNQSNSSPASPIASRSATVQVVNVHDGDTLRVLIDGKQERIRLCGIDAPELKQQLGEASRNHLRSLVQRSNNQVRLTVVDTDRYGREVAEISSPSGTVLNVEQVKSGNAYVYRQYASKCPHEAQLQQAETAAQQSRQGVWKYPNALKPWDYRKQQRQAK